MGIYIKNMEIPTSCYQCNFCVNVMDGEDLVVICTALEKEIIALMAERQDDCPLVEVSSAEVVEVVRCKDCSHGYKTSYPSELRICLMTGCANSENHFCSDGKRMDGGI